MVADLNEKIVAINELLNGADGILPLKAQRIAASAEAATLLATAETQTTEASTALTELLTKARTAAGEIQTESADDVSSAIMWISIVGFVSVVVAILVALKTRQSITEH